MVGTKNNRRTKYTVTVIKEAFLDLLNQKELSQITVTEICEKANVNRGTFYLHYKDSFDLYRQIEDDLMQEILPLLSLLPKEDLKDWLHRLLLILQKNTTLAKILVKNFHQEALINKIFVEVYDQAIQNFKEKFQETNQQHLEYYFTYFVQGTLGVILEWFENEQDLTVDEMSTILANLLPGY
ncbi:MAG TPA: TetR/AcrR family transcriptional regulator [Candidatus Tetragenococcus pullicola]|nr:TetR/AcrR family transcriptional regulator [Candidatus Tetragenococcus pullicola]